MKTLVYFSEAAMTNKKSFATSICHNLSTIPIPSGALLGAPVNKQDQALVTNITED
jgi:hypothetical protein